MRITITPLLGRIPRRSNRGLGQNNATIADNCDVRSGEIRPFRKSRLVQAVSQQTESIHRWRTGDQRFWLEFQGKADVINGPVADDVWERIYWTGDALHDEPRMSYTGPLQNAGPPFPDISYKLGVPAPEDRITATLTEPEQLEIEEIVLERPMRVITKEPHGLETDELVQFEIEDEPEGEDDDRESLAELLNANEQQIVVLTDNQFTVNFTDGVTLDYRPFTGGTVEPYAGPDVQDVRVYVHTYVTDIGEEGPPSPASDEVRATPFQETVLTLPALDTLAGTGRNIQKRRIYRASTGTQATQFQFLDELDVSQNEYRDTRRELQESIPSIAFDPPAENLKGLRMAAQGFAVGFFDNVVAFSEPYLVHAWPTDYQIALDYEVVAIEVIDNGVVVGTTGRPYIIQGIEPRSMTPRRIELSHACVSQRSMVSLGYAAVYASKEGLVLVDSSQARLMTREFFTEKEWSAYKPETIHAYELNGRYIGFYGDEEDGAGFIVDPRELDLGWFDLGFWAEDGFRDFTDERLFLLQDGEIREWDHPGADAKPFRWRSKEFSLPFGMAVSAFRLSGSGNLTFRLFADGQKIYEREVTPEVYSRLPKRRAVVYQVEVEGTGVLQEIHVADSIEVLRQ